MIDHLKLLSVIFNVIVGSGVFIYILLIHHRYRYRYLKYLAIHVLLTNIGLLFLFIVKYIDLNITTNFHPINDGIFSTLGYLFVIVLFISFGLIVMKIVMEFLEYRIPTKLERNVLLGLFIYVLLYLVKYVLPDESTVGKIHYFIYENITGIMLFLELGALVFLIVKVKMIQDRNKARIARWFAYFYLSRYAWVLVVILLPQPFRILLFGIGLNAIPFFWTRYFFQNYTYGLMQKAGNEIVFTELTANYQISQREQEIIRLILDGKSNQAIADELFVSLKTVKNHIYNIYQKLNIKSRYELIRMISNMTLF